MSLRYRITIVACVTWSAWTVPSYALSFVDLVYFDGPEVGPVDTGSISVADNAPPAWVHDLLDDLGGASLGSVAISEATLTVTYRRTSDSTESWSLAADGLAVGALVPTNTPIVTTAYPLSPALLAALQADGRLSIVPLESTTGTDTFRLYWSSLTGEYSVTPEPGTALLLVGGLLGLLRRRRV